MLLLILPILAIGLQALRHATPSRLAIAAILSNRQAWR